METEKWLKGLCPEIAAWQIELIAEHIERVVMREREECAKVCESINADHDSVIVEICVGAIRGRGEK